VGGVLRFASSEGYATGFGLQWRRFARTQVDRYNGSTISRDWFFAHTPWTAEELKGLSMLDAGCGSGRFSQVALDAGATVIAVDLSSAVDACRTNLADYERLTVVQADLTSLPFADESLDAIFSIGVLQHTPEPMRILRALPRYLRHGGRLAIWTYERTLRGMLHPKYVLRPITRRLKPATLLRMIEAAAPLLLRASDTCVRVPAVGRYVARCVPVANYRDVFPLDGGQLLDWAILDTFDWLCPAYDRPLRWAGVKVALEEGGLRNVRRIAPATAGLAVAGEKP
jgi:SAM-dependent methyltransferase